MPPQIDPQTGERIGAVQIDPATGERVTAAPTEKPPSLMQRAAGGAEDIGLGILKGAGSTANAIGSVIYPDWLARHLTGVPTEEQKQGYFAPRDTMQAVGKGAEQAAEFLAPGMGEERAMSLLPKVGKEAPLAMRLLQPAARVGYQGLTSGLVNKAQGGEFGTGAGVGLLGGVGGEAMKAAAPYLAESALGTRWLERGGGRGGGAIGKAALDETRGLLPETVRESAKDRIGQLYGERQAALAPWELAPGAMMNRAPVSMAPVRAPIEEAMQRMGPLSKGGMSAPSLFGELGEMRNSLLKEGGTGAAIPEYLPPETMGRLQQGFSREHLNWSPLRTNSPEVTGAGRQAYGAMTGELERSVPESVDLNRRIASLMPVQEAANRRSLQAGIGQRMMGRVGAHSGALLGSVAGGTYGYEREGLPGAVKYGALGLALPELVASPAGQMGMARILYKTGPRLLPAVTGAGLGQLDRPRITSDPATW